MLLIPLQEQEGESYEEKHKEKYNRIINEIIDEYVRKKKKGNVFRKKEN